MDDAYRLDKENGNIYRSDTISKEIKNVRVAFNILHGYEKVPPAHKFIRFHMIFDANSNNFKRKAWYVTGGHMMKPPSSITSAIFVSR